MMEIRRGIDFRTYAVASSKGPLQRVKGAVLLF